MSKLLFKRNNVLVYSDGKIYKQVGPNESIRKGALHSITAGVYYPLTWESTIGKTPSEMSIVSDRLFFNPLTDAEKKALKKGWLS